MGDIVPPEKFPQGWRGGLPETPCGFGSRLDQTVAQRAWIKQLVMSLKVQTVADIGAGDLNWVKHIKWPKRVEYRAYDLCVRDPSVIQFDLLKEVPPQVDLLMCLWVLNHFSVANCRTALANLKASGSSYLLMTDRPKWHAEQPPEIATLPVLEEMLLREDTGDRLLLVDLSLC